MLFRSARRVMRLADKEARHLNYEYLGTEPMLLALVQDKGGVAVDVDVDVRRNLNISLGKIRYGIERFQTKSEFDASARPLRPNLERYIEDPIAEYLLRDDFRGCDTIQVEVPNRDSSKIEHLSFRGFVCGADGPKTTADAVTTGVD